MEDDDYRILEADSVSVEMSLNSNGSVLITVEDQHDPDHIIDFILEPDEFLELADHIRTFYRQAKRIKRSRTKCEG